MKMKIITSAVTTTLFLASREFAGAIEGDEPERIVIGPDYKSDPAWFDCSDCDKGERIDLFMPIANTTFNCEPEDFPELLPECSVNCGQIYGTPGTRNITVYIPSGFDDSNAAALQIGIEDTDFFYNYDAYKSEGANFTTDDGYEMNITSYYPNVMDNLVGAEDEERSLPMFVYVAVGLAGPGSIAAYGDVNCGDNPGTERSIELVTVSDAYAEFLAFEVLPYVANHPDIKAKYPNFRFTDDPLGRVVSGQSNGGAAAFKTVFLRPDLFGTAIGFSAAIAEAGYNLTSDDEYPLNNADFWVPPPDGQGLIAAEPLRDGRFYLMAGENDVGTENGCISGNPTASAPTKYNNFAVANNETAIALAKKGYEVRFVYGLDACHTDKKWNAAEEPNAMLWAWSAWKDQLESDNTTSVGTVESDDEGDDRTSLATDDGSSIAGESTTTDSGSVATAAAGTIGSIVAGIGAIIASVALL